jgi:Outer membrane protein beta-barrel domain
LKTRRESQLTSDSPTLRNPSPAPVVASRDLPFGLLLRRFIQRSLTTLLLLGSLGLVRAQDQPKWNFNIGGGIGFPQGDLSSFINDGGNFVVGGGYNVNHYLSMNGEFMWHDLPVNSATKEALQTPGASARQYALTFDPMVHFPLGHRLGAYAIGGIGWYHRSGETTTPGTAVICDPYWSWWYGCTIGNVTIVTGSTSADSFGENIGGGVTYRLSENGLKFYTEFRYHHATYDKVSTNLIPLTFGIRW